jgi:hypothetical protein
MPNTRNEAQLLDEAKREALAAVIKAAQAKLGPNPLAFAEVYGWLSRQDQSHN